MIEIFMAILSIHVNEIKCFRECLLILTVALLIQGQYRLIWEVEALFGFVGDRDWSWNGVDP